jgi:predicted outer membrane repeat protein
MKRHHRAGLYAPELLEARIAPATFTVNSLLDNGLDGTLRKEIADANLAPGADTIVFKLTDPLLPHTIVLNTATGEIPITGPLIIKGPGIDLLSVSGSDLIRIFKITDGAADVLSPTTISGLTLTDGKTADNGGALYSAEPLTLKNVVVRSSYAGNRGGGVFAKTDGKISVAGSRIVHNKAHTVNGGGGGLYLHGDAGVSVVKTTIADNTADKNGGLYAIAQGPKSVILVDTCIIANNTATSGIAGGVRFDGVADGKIIVKNSIISGNTSAAAGGGLYLREGNLVISNTTISNNSAPRGGGLDINQGASVSISGSRFLGNQATAAGDLGGGALFFQGLATNTPGTLVKISSSLFSHNSSASDGGALAHIDKVVMNITGSSFLGNTAADDGGAFALGDKAVLTMKGSILSGNAAGTGAANNGGAIFVHTASGMLFPVTPTVLTLTGNKFTENSALNGGGIFMEGTGVVGGKAILSGNLFQANLALGGGGAVYAKESSDFSSKGDRFIGNVARGQGGGVYLINTGGTILTSALIQSNVAGSSGGGGVIAGDATLTGVKILDNIGGAGGRGGGLRISGGTVVIAKSLVTGNVANDGGGIFFNIGTTTIDTVTKVIGNVAASSPNIGSA